MFKHPGVNIAVYTRCVRACVFVCVCVCVYVYVCMCVCVCVCVLNQLVYRSITSIYCEAIFGCGDFLTVEVCTSTYELNLNFYL